MSNEHLGEQTEALANEVLANSKDKDALKMAEALLYVLPYYRKYVREHGELTTELETLRSEKLDALVRVNALQGVVGRVMELANDGKDSDCDTQAKDRAFGAIIKCIDTYAALNTQPQAEWTPRRMQIKHGYNMWFYRQSNQPAITFKEGDIVNAGETDHNGTHVRNLEDNAGTLIPTKFLAPVDND